MTRRTAAWRSLVLVLGPAGCGGSSKPSFPTIGAARTYALASFSPSAAGRGGQADARLVRDPSAGREAADAVQARARAAHRRAPDHRAARPRDDHPPASADRGGRDDQRDAHVPGARAVPGRRRRLPEHDGPQPNFQLFGSLRVAGRYVPQPLARVHAARSSIDGYRVTLQRHDRRCTRSRRRSLTITVTDPSGKPAEFTPWFGALAHAIFFREGSLDYFHTHVCAPGAAGCTSVLGAAKVTGSSSTPGKLTVGVLVPVPGTWRLFLQCQVDGHVLTAPFTLGRQAMNKEPAP